MIQAMYNGVSGLRAHKTMMDVISNNIANINTVGFKASRVSFKEMFNQTVRGATAPKPAGVGGTNPAQIGLGTSIGSIDVSQNQGSLQPTGKLTDLAIEGDGFLILGDGQGRYYSRDGSLIVDSAGNLVAAGSGLKVLGWMADPVTGEIDTSAPISASSTISLPSGQLARQTTKVTYGGNLDSTTAPGDTCRVSALIYDSLGTAYALTITFTKAQRPLVTQGYADVDVTPVGSGNITIKVGAGTPDETTTTIAIPVGDTLDDLCAAIDAVANVDATIVDAGAAAGADRYHIEVRSTNGRQVDITSSLAGGTPPIFSISSEGAGEWTWDGVVGGASVGSGTITFDGSGKSPTATGAVSIDLTNGANSPLDATLSFAAITQSSGDTTVSATSQDGLPLGMLANFTIGKDGVISGVFTNGISQPLARIALAIFSNPSGLSKAGDNLLIEGSNSGLPQIGEPAVGSVGKVIAGFLESSNVDLPTEFSNMIVAQRGFQANSRIITTSDEILQELVQMKR